MLESLQETENWGAIGFIIFLGLLAYLGVHRKLVGALDQRQARIKAELDEAVTWQSATIGVTAISSSRDYLSGLMRQVENAAVRIANDLGAQVADSWCTFLEEDSED